MEAFPASPGTWAGLEVPVHIHTLTVSHIITHPGALTFPPSTVTAGGAGTTLSVSCNQGTP